MMATFRSMIMRTLRISEKDVIFLLRTWNVPYRDMDEGYKKAAINYLALQRIGIDFDQMLGSKQAEFHERCNTSFVLVRKTTQDETGYKDESFYSVYIELFPEGDYLKRATKEN